MKIKFEAELWLYPGKAAWYFITLTDQAADEIEESYKLPKRGFGSIPVRVKVGKTVWETSVFPDKKTFSYFLPIKAMVRKTEGIKIGQKLKIQIEPR